MYELSKLGFNLIKNKDGIESWRKVIWNLNERCYVIDIGLDIDNHVVKYSEIRNVCKTRDTEETFYRNPLKISTTKAITSTISRIAMDGATLTRQIETEDYDKAIPKAYSIDKDLEFAIDTRFLQ